MKLLDQEEETAGEEEPGLCAALCGGVQDDGKREELKDRVRKNKMKVAGGCCTLLLLITLIVVLSQLCYSSIRDDLNKKNGILSPHLRRKVIKPRPNFEETVFSQNLTYHDEPTIEWSYCETDAYWNEEGAAIISSSAEMEILEATWQMHSMCLEVVDTVVRDPKLLRLFRVPTDLWPAVRESWSSGQRDFLGRFDWSYDGKNPPKMLEYNGDTPSLLMESSRISLLWKKDYDKRAQYLQSNYLEAAIR